MKIIIMSKIINFVKYNNAFTIGIAVILLVTGGVFASEDLRDTVIGETITIVAGIDNTAILALDADNFDLKLTIQNVTEDADSYYISYSYIAMGIKDNVWQPITIEKTLNVSKERLGDIDLGAYVSVQLGELADYELNRIKEVKFIEASKGVQTQMASITYTGLKGLIFDSENKVLEGYTPVVVEEKEDISGDFSPSQNSDNNVSEDTAEPENSPTIIVQVVKETINREEVRRIIQEMLADQSVSLDSSNSSNVSDVSEYSESSGLPEPLDSLIISADLTAPPDLSDQSVSLDSPDSSNVSGMSDSLISPDSSVASEDTSVSLGQFDQPVSSAE